MSDKSSKSPSQTRQRWPREQRERFILERAAELFAERGFGLSTRELANAIGITQALLYQYFDSKQALIEQVFETTFLAPPTAEAVDVLHDHGLSLEARLVGFYEAFASERLTATRQRLFLRANLDGLDLARRFSTPLDARVLAPIVAALRDEFDLPGLDARPMTGDERELVMMLHGSIVFLGLRKHVYAIGSLGRLDTHVRRHVRVFLHGALDVMRERGR